MTKYSLYKRSKRFSEKTARKHGYCVQCGRKINARSGEGFRISKLRFCFECYYPQDFVESTDAHMKYVERVCFDDEENSGLW